MNRLVPLADGRYHLPRHAHIVVYDGNDRELLTVYDCGAAQKPPTAQLLGTLGRIGVEHRLRRTTTGYTVSLGEAAVLVREGDGHLRIAPAHA